MQNKIRLLKACICLIGCFTLSTSGAEDLRDHLIDIKQKTKSINLNEPDHLVPSQFVHANRRYLMQLTTEPALTAGWVIEIVPSNDGAAVIEFFEKSGKEFVLKNSKAIDKELTKEIYSAWVYSLLETKCPEHSHLGADGETYYFESYVFGLGWISGNTWSPRRDAPPLRLVEIGNDLRKYASATDDSNQARVRILINTKWIMNFLNKSGLYISPIVNDK